MAGKIVVVGLGEVGKPLFQLAAEHTQAVGVDIEPVELQGECEIMHICIPFQVNDFIGKCAEYTAKYNPKLTVINSTVAVGTTRKVFERTHAPIAYSPVRGKHIRMKQEMLHYVKFLGGIDAESSLTAALHFQSIGMKTKILSSPEAAELAKLTETTYFGLLITWAQEIERYCDQLSLNYDEIVSIFEEIGYLPQVKFTPGVIGGHCVMPNIAILKTIFESELLDVMQNSNDMKKSREAGQVS